MKNFSSLYYNNVIGVEATTIATCFRLELKDGRILGFTTCSDDVIFQEEPNLTYLTASASKTAFSATNSMAVDNMDATILIESDEITKTDLEKGVYDDAKLRVFRFNYQLKPFSYNDIDKIVEGTVGEVTRNKGTYTTEFRSKTQYLQNSVIETVTPTCRANLGDERCRKDLTNFIFDGVITSVTDFTTITIDVLKEDHYFAYGNLFFTSGLSASDDGHEVKDNIGNTITLQLPSEYTFAVGDTIRIRAGCDKLKTTCINKFNNVLNFRGFSFVPGLDSLTSS